MKILINELNEYYSEKVRLIITVMKREFVEEYPELIKWALQVLYFDGNKWVKICRIDNYMHEGVAGSHIHIYQQTRVERIALSYQEARERIKKIAQRLLREKFEA